MRTGGALMVECLESLGARQAFGVPGESYLEVLDALHDARLEMMLARHEGGAGFMAAAWGKLTGEPGIAFVTRGPGATNASIGVHSALQDSSPMLLFIGQVGLCDRGREAFQEVDYRAMFGPLAKWVTEIDRAERIPETLSRAWALALSGRPGPVVIALPEDMLREETDAQPCAPVRIASAAPSAEDVSEVLDLIAGAERPLILAGGTGWSGEGRAALRRFAENNGLPVAVSFRRQDVIDNASPSFVGDAGVGMRPYLQDLIRRADVVLAIGPRLGEMATGAYSLMAVPNPEQTLIHVHPSAAEHGKVYAPALPIACDVNRLAIALGDEQLGDWSGITAQARSAFFAMRSEGIAPDGLPLMRAMAFLDEAMDTDAIVTNGAGNFSIWPSRFLTYKAERRLLAPQSGSMGYGIPAAIAAKRRYPERQVICFAGDGDFQMTAMELAAAAQEGLGIMVILLDNSQYGTIRAHQEGRFPGRVSGTQMRNPDFVALARAFGMEAESVPDLARFPEAFSRAKASRSGALLHIRVPAELLTPWKSISGQQVG